jgi:DNA topoisomerase-1
MKSLIIVESFTKTKTIKKYLNDSYIVSFSSGHIYDLPKDSLGIDVKNWSTQLIPIHKKIIQNLKDLAKQCDVIYLASDPDLEGEAISYHLKCCLSDSLKNKKCYRITFNEITKNSILNALSNHHDIDMNKVEAQESRRIVDRLIGYKVSPILWSEFNNKFLSAGRVQIAGLILCINQKNKIMNKEIIPYWNIEGYFECNHIKLEASLYANNSVWKTVNHEELYNMLKVLKINEDYDIKYTLKNRNVNPLPPFMTTSMQQEAYNKLRFNSKITMKLAQDLYENGHITYMRTDSTNISDDAKKLIMNYIKKEYGDNKAKYRVYKTKVINAQEAHEAIRITNPNVRSVVDCFDGASDKHQSLYDLIWKRTIVCLMVDAVYTDIHFIISNDEREFRNTKSFLTDEGFNIVYNIQKDDYTEYLNNLRDICRSIEFKGMPNIDNIPSMFNEVQLIKELEKEGIGRPSTYSSIIDKLISKKYVELGKNPETKIELDLHIKTSCIKTFKKTFDLGGKAKDLLIPTILGIDVMKYLYDKTPFLCDLKFTAKMEEELDDIIHNKTSKSHVLNTVYTKICESLTNIEEKSVEKKSGIVNTKYGSCYYDHMTNKYTNIEIYLAWRKITTNELTEIDMNFFRSLPKQVRINGQLYYVHLGKYGLYLKDINGNNLKLDKNLWHHYIV